jgi:sugar phosphate isomerase/epimerase
MLHRQKTPRRKFIKQSVALGLGAWCIPSLLYAADRKDVGIQLYTVRDEMLKDPKGTLKELAKIGYKELESARSAKGNYYGLSAKEIRKITADLGMNVRSGHVHLDKDFQKSIDQAVEAGQQYLIVSSMPYEGQTVEVYQKTADAFSAAGEQCKKANLVFGYHNHDYEFEKVNGKALYDILLERTQPDLVSMELDLGWVVVTGNDPVSYFERFPGRFPLWHLKDMDIQKKHSTEFGKGDLNISQMLDNAGKSGLKYYFVEQEEYTSTPFESIRHNYDYLKKL